MRPKMRLKVIGCEVLARPIYLCAARSPHIVDVTFLRRGLHETPADLGANLQEEIDRVGPEYGAAVLLYGLCGGATAGLRAGRVPLVVPRAHDCITVFLGSRDRYREEFTSHPGTYWYALDYLEREDTTSSSTGMLGIGAATDAELQVAYEQYVELYGKDNADYLMETLGAWRDHYDRAAFVDMGIGDGGVIEEQARAEAASRGWLFERIAGDMALVRRAVEGDWDGDYLVLQPGQRLVQTYDEGVIGAE
jgi:hypothetical protein